MTAQCCTGGGPSRRLARRLSAAAASILPGAALLLLPKCPLCIAAWLTLATGIAVPAAAARGVRGLIVLFWITTLALVATWLARRARRRTHFIHSPKKTVALRAGRYILIPGRSRK